MLVAGLVVAGIVLGLVVGRWWALLACVAVGVWIGVAEEVEVPGWFLGSGYAVLSAIGVGAGIVLRRRLRELSRERPPAPRRRARSRPR